MTFEDMWKSLEEKDTTGKYKQAREMAELNVEQLEYAYNSGYADAKSKYERPQYILKVKNLTTEDKKHFQECWNKSAGGLLAIISDDYEIIPIERPQGKWIFYKDYNESCRYGCNLCGNLNNIPSNFCPNCGAEMQKGSAE